MHRGAPEPDPPHAMMASAAILGRRRPSAGAAFVLATLLGLVSLASAFAPLGPFSSSISSKACSRRRPSWVYAEPPSDGNGQAKDGDVDFFFPDGGFSSLMDDPKAGKGPKSPFEGGSTILLGEEEDDVYAQLQRQEKGSPPPPPPVSRRAVSGSGSGSGGTAGGSSSGGASGRKGPKRFTAPWQQDGAAGPGRRSRGSGGSGGGKGGLMGEPPSARFGGSFQPAQPRSQRQQQQQQQEAGSFGFDSAGNPLPPPTRVYRPPGSFDLDEVRPSSSSASARQSEDAQMFRLLGAFGNPNTMLAGGIALFAGAGAFLYAWKSGALENSSPSAAMMRDPEATEYMLRSEFPRDVDVTVKIDDKVVQMAEDGEVDIL